MMSDIQLTEYGPMSGDLLSANLSDLCVEKIGVQTGPFGSQLHKEDYVEIGTPIITVEHLGDNRIIHQDTPCVSDEDKERLSKYHLQEGDIVFSRVGSVDRRALVRKEEDGWLFSGRCLRVRVDKNKIDPVYLSYFFGLEGFKNYIRSIAVGATMPSINTKILSDVPIYYPEDLEEQRRIASIFYTNDEKIELNRQINQTLEQIAQAIFKSWFVDFEPVKAKAQVRASVAEGRMPGSDQNTPLPPDFDVEAAVERAAMRAISGKTDEQLDQLSHEQRQQLTTASALFPDALVESELGEVPDGWGVGMIGDLFELHRGFDLPKNDRKDGPYPVYAAGGYHGQHAEFKMEPPGIITGRSGVIGNVYLSLTKYWPLNTTLYVREFKHCGPYYAYFFLNMFDLKSINSGSAVPSLNRNFVHSMNCLMPDGSLLDVFEKFTNSNFVKIKSNDSEVELLSSLRALLLYKLLSGEIEINNNQNMEVAANG